MKPIDWLKQNAPGFDNLSNEDRQAVSYFTFLWSLFEARALNNSASAQSILRRVSDREADGLLDPTPFQNSLQYFCDRYFSNGHFTANFDDLNFRGNDHKSLVEGVLQGTDKNPANQVAALLIIIYRLRNNLFHGMKWAYGIQGQRSNFEHSNTALMVALEQLV